MLRRLTLAALLALAPTLASAQFATIAPTPPTADNGDRIATTAWVNSWAASAIPLASGKIFIGSAGNVAVPQTPSGDLTVSVGGLFTLGTVNANVGTFGSATTCITTTQNAKGLTTAISAATCTPAIGSITGLGTGIATALGVNVGTAGSPVVNGGVLGTPSSGTATNLTGTASGLTAGNVTTNANLTGPVTSVGNATTIGANQVSRANEAQGVARSVVGVTGNATANVADIQGTASQFFGVNSAGTALAFQTMSGDATLSGPAITVTKVNGVDQTAAWSAYTATPSCNTGAGTWTTNTAKSKQLGKTVFWQIDATITAIGTCSGSAWKFNLPSTPVSGGGGAGAETVVSGVSVICGYSAASAVVSCGAGAALVVNNRFVASGVYEGP